jgi:hypothetical protein
MRENNTRGICFVLNTSSQRHRQQKHGGGLKPFSGAPATFRIVVDSDALDSVINRRTNTATGEQRRLAIFSARALCLFARPP